MCTVDEEMSFKNSRYRGIIFSTVAQDQNLLRPLRVDLAPIWATHIMGFFKDLFLCYVLAILILL